jgi:transcriptional regulator of heat shock response
METVNIDQMMLEIRQEVARQVSRRKTTVAVSHKPTTSTDLLYLSGQLNQIEAVLNLAESRSHVRTQLPEKFQNHPLTAGKIKGAMLKVFNLAFRDQREVNGGLIQASRHSNQVNQQVLQELMSLRNQMKQMQAQIDQLSSSKS